MGRPSWRAPSSASSPRGTSKRGGVVRQGGEVARLGPCTRRKGGGRLIDLVVFGRSGCGPGRVPGRQVSAGAAFGTGFEAQRLSLRDKVAQARPGTVWKGSPRPEGGGAIKACTCKTRRADCEFHRLRAVWMAAATATASAAAGVGRTAQAERKRAVLTTCRQASGAERPRRTGRWGRGKLERAAGGGGDPSKGSHL